MNRYFAYILKAARKVYRQVFHIEHGVIMPINTDEEDERASKLIYDTLVSDKPCMIARFGSFELNTVLVVDSMLSKKHSIMDFIMGRQFEWWWDSRSNLRYYIQNNAGFFPVTDESLLQYKDRMFADMLELDVLGDFAGGVRYIEPLLKEVKRVHLKNLEPFYGSAPWTKALEGKKILIIHPLADLIAEQYKKYREFIFKSEKILPKFELYTIKAVQSLGGKNKRYSSWFDALSWMESEMDKINYDIALIGCGAYGFCLAAHAKRMGKKGFHIGGVLQYLFGIKGRRWENPDYNVDAWKIPKGFYSNRINEFWIRPSQRDVPANAANVENSCYW